MNRFDYDQIPPHMMDAIHRYVDNHIAPGGFLTAVICNDLQEACSRADDHNIAIIPVYVAYLYNEVPSGCWGSHEAMEHWMEKGKQDSTS